VPMALYRVRRRLVVMWRSSYRCHEGLVSLVNGDRPAPLLANLVFGVATSRSKCGGAQLFVRGQSLCIA
jgi:hypothetical protein